jgi:hypothetical protein
MDWWYLGLSLRDLDEEWMCLLCDSCPSCRDALCGSHVVIVIGNLMGAVDWYLGSSLRDLDHLIQPGET